MDFVVSGLMGFNKTENLFHDTWENSVAEGKNKFRIKGGLDGSGFNLEIFYINGENNYYTRCKTVWIYKNI